VQSHRSAGCGSVERRGIVVCMTRSVRERHAGPVDGCRPDEGPARPLAGPSDPAATRAGVLLTITGRHRPEVVGQLFAALAGHDGSDPLGELTDVGQVILHGRLVLVVAVRPVRDGRSHADMLLARLIRLAEDLSTATGLEVAVAGVDSPPLAAPDRGRLRVTILGSPVQLDAVAAAIQGVIAAGGRVEAMSSMSGNPLTGVELLACGARPAVLCPRLAWVAAVTGADIAVA
jgi:predicted amino acid-binding ACT domain protein